MATVTKTTWVWRVQADMSVDDTEITFQRFIRQETFVDGASVGVIELPPDIKTQPASDLLTVDQVE